MLKTRAIILFLFCAFSFFLKAQNNYDYSIDTLTYRQYQNASWESLYQTVRDAEKKGYDFYYLTLRGAFAAFHTQRYAQANDLFNMAQQQFNGEDLVKEYHYLAALYSGKKLETIKTYKQLPPQVQSKYTQPKNKRVESIHLETGFNFNQDFNSLREQPIHGGFDTYGERVLFQHSSYNSIGLKHEILPYLSLYQSFQKITLSKLQQFYAVQYAPRDTFQYDYPKNTQQYQYHISATYNIKDQFFISPAFTHVWYNTDTYSAAFTELNQVVFIPSKSKGIQSLASLTLTAKFNKLSVDINGNYLWMDTYHRWQTGFNLNYWPLQKKTVYIGAGWQFQTQDPFYKRPWDYSVVNFKLGAKIKSVWLEANYSGGNLRNYSEANGLILFNTLEQVQSLAGANLSIPMRYKQLWLHIYYRHLSYRSSYGYFENELPLTDADFHHNNHSISGGLSWYF